MVSRYWVGGGLAEGVCSGGFGLSADIGRKGCIRICVRCGYFGGGGGGSSSKRATAASSSGPTPSAPPSRAAAAALAGKVARDTDMWLERFVLPEELFARNAASLPPARSGLIGVRAWAIGSAGSVVWASAPTMHHAWPDSPKVVRQRPSRPNPSQKGPPVQIRAKRPCYRQSWASFEAFRGFSQSSPDAAEVQFRISGQIGLLGRLSCPTKTA